MSNETEPLPTETPTAVAPTPAETAGPERPRRGILRPVLIGAAAGLAVLALGFGGAVIADIVDTDDTITVSSRDDDSDRGGTPSPMSSSNVPTPTPIPTLVDDSTPITEDERAAVSAAAIAAAGGSGTIEELKREDDGGVAWEIDVRVPNGAKVEVELGAGLEVISTRIDD